MEEYNGMGAEHIAEPGNNTENNRRKHNMEYRHEIKIPNGKTANLDEVRCPVCGELMEIDKGDVTMPRSELEYRNCRAPFSGTMIDQRIYRDIRLKCPYGCCTVEITKCETVSCVGRLG